MTIPIPVICDCCRAHGLAGDDPFAAFGALLDFDPVPRRKTRADGWDAEVQRAYIAALSLTGSDRAACRAVGRSAFGVTQLLDCPGSEGFRAAREEALAIAADERSRRLAEGLRAVAAEQSGWRPPAAPWSRAASRRATPAPEPEKAMTGEQKMEWLANLVRKYLYKVAQEREDRLSGNIVAADFYLRQMTHIEVMLDLMGTDGFKVLLAFREGGHHLVDIAETPMSRVLDGARRAHWAGQGEPPRPEHPPRDRLVDHRRFSTEPLEYTEGGQALSHEEQKRRFEERHRQDAEDQIAWEARARQDFESRRESAT